MLHESEIERLFSTVKNVKHKVMLYTAYSAGLRVSELVNLRLEDIRKPQKQIRIIQSKGKKDRIGILSEKLLLLLKEYLKKHNPKEWLFEGAHGEAYSVRSVQKIFSRAKSSAGTIASGCAAGTLSAGASGRAATGELSAAICG